MMAIQSYRDLLVWQKSMDLVTEIYQLTRPFPQEELFGLTSQTRRAAVSVPANIAEGYGRIHRKEYLYHLSIARGSLMEVETHLQIALRLTYLSREQGAQIWSLLQEVGRLLNGLIRSLKADSSDGQIKEESEEYHLPDLWPLPPEP
jgi:four helix bundle protein